MSLDGPVMLSLPDDCITYDNKTSTCSLIVQHLSLCRVAAFLNKRNNIQRAQHKLLEAAYTMLIISRPATSPQGI